MNKRGFRAWAGLGAVLIAAAGCSRSGGDDKPFASALTVEVKQGPLVITVRGSGDVRARNSKKIIPPIKRQAMITFLIPDGSQVVSNTVVARLNTDDIERRMKDLESAVMDASNKLVNARTDLEIQVMDNTSTLKKTEQDLQAARMELQKLIQGDDPMERRNAEVKLQIAESDFARRQRRYEELRGLLKEGFVTEDEVEEERLQLETAKLSVETTAIEKRLLNEYSLPLKQAAAEAALAKATTEMDKAHKQTQALYSNKRQAVDSAQRVVDRAVADLDLVCEEMRAYEVRAPGDGVLMYGNPDESWRRGDISVGGNYSPGQVLMTIPNRAAMQAVINIPEADIQNIKAGQPVTVTVEALADRNFAGTVTKVAEVANAGGWWSGDLKEFKVEIELANGRELRPGFSCRAEIVTDTIPAALFLPVNAVFRDGEKFHIYEAAAGHGVRTEIKIGRSSVQFVELLTGLKPGTRVYLNPPAKAPEKS
jgi:HlyD family secretion protein